MQHVIMHVTCHIKMYATCYIIMLVTCHVIMQATYNIACDVSYNNPCDMSYSTAITIIWTNKNLIMYLSIFNNSIGLNYLYYKKIIVKNVQVILVTFLSSTIAM